METTETIETTAEAVEQNANVALTVITYAAAVALIGVAGYKVGGFVSQKLAVRRAAKVLDVETMKETHEEN